MAPSRNLDRGLALSGGGFRATLFNLGSLWRLNELGYLKTLDVITSVSGGSITSGVLALHWKELQFSHGVAGNFKELVAQPLMDFCKLNVDIGAGIGGILSLFDSIPEQVAEKYDEELFHKATLQDLPDETLDPANPNYGPRFLFYATSLQTGSSVRLCRKRLADYKIGEIRNPKTPLATVVAASSAFPPVLSPVELKTDPDDWVELEGAFLYGDTELRKKMYLSDGGVYDNMGLESIQDRCKVVLVSDAGAPLAVEEAPSKDWTRQTLRVLDIITEQTRTLRRRQLVDDFKNKIREGTYWGIRTKIGAYGLPDPLVADNPTTASLAGIRTRLNHFSDKEQGQLVNWGYALTDAAMRKYVMPAAPRGSLPFSRYPL
ncbi:patatin-like phospholipase family protein [Solidesulfovibrio sp.]